VYRARRQERQSGGAGLFIAAPASGQWRGSQVGLARIGAGVPACTAPDHGQRGHGWPRTRMPVRSQSRLSTSSCAICTRRNHCPIDAGASSQRRCICKLGLSGARRPSAARNSSIAEPNIQPGPPIRAQPFVFEAFPLVGQCMPHARPLFPMSSAYTCLTCVVLLLLLPMACLQGTLRQTFRAKKGLKAPGGADVRARDPTFSPPTPD